MGKLRSRARRKPARKTDLLRRRLQGEALEVRALPGSLLTSLLGVGVGAGIEGSLRAAGRRTSDAVDHRARSAPQRGLAGKQDLSAVLDQLERGGRRGPSFLPFAEAHAREQGRDGNRGERTGGGWAGVGDGGDSLLRFQIDIGVSLTGLDHGEEDGQALRWRVPAPVSGGGGGGSIYAGGGSGDAGGGGGRGGGAAPSSSAFSFETLGAGFGVASPRAAASAAMSDLGDVTPPDSSSPAGGAPLGSSGHTASTTPNTGVAASSGNAPASPVAAPQRVVPGDFNADGTVDGGDFLTWQRNLGKSNGATPAQGDADLDGDVDGFDRLAWSRNFGMSPQQYAASAELVPGDFDGDGAVGSADGAIWRGEFGASSGATVDQGDSDGDGDVDGGDFLVWQRNLGKSAAQALRLLDPTVTRDDGDWGYIERGVWQTVAGAGGWQGDYRTATPGTGDKTADWVTILPAGEYEVFATWVAGANHATSARYRIIDGATVLATAVRDQTAAPIDATFDGRMWESLGSYNIATGVPTVRLTNDPSGLVVADGVMFVPKVDCTFDDNLTGWRVVEDGGTPAGRGGVDSIDCAAVLREGDSFRVSLEQTFVVPAGATSLSFRYDALSFDLTDPDFINDAFEVALVDQTGASLVPTYAGDFSRDAFLNASEGLPLQLGQGVAASNGLVTVSLAGVAAGTRARLVFRLANDDLDTATSVRIVDVNLPAGATPIAENATAKFFVVDATSDEVFRYSAAGTGRGDFSTAPVNENARGVASSADGSVIWTIDGTTRRVHVQGPDGTSLGAWRTAGLAAPQGITVGGNDLWIVDSALDRVFFFAGAGARRSGEAAPTSSFALAQANSSPSDLVVDAAGQRVWVVDDAADAVFVYNLSGALQGSWALDPANADASGITLDPTGAVGDLWTVDRVDKRVYQYANARSRTGGAQSAADSFVLAAGNVAPEGIADPPPSTVAASTPQNSVPVGQSILITGEARADGQLADRTANRIVAITVNGRGVDVIDAAGNFFVSAVVQPGENRFEFAALDAAGEEARTTVVVTGTQVSARAIDLSQYADVTGSFTGEFGRTSFSDASKRMFVDLAIRNDGSFPARAPLLVGVKNLRLRTEGGKQESLGPSTLPVRLLDPAGSLPDGTPYLDLSALVPGGQLAPGASTGSRTLVFANPDRLQFDFDLVVLAQLNRAPSITSVPDVEALLGRPYAYDADATDPDGDALVYRLRESPAGMTINAATGAIAWTPAANQEGNHTVVVEVDDQRGGKAQQRYALSLIPAPPNRPPVITSVPVVDATVAISSRSAPIPLDPTKTTSEVYFYPPGVSSGPADWQPQGDGTVRQLRNSDPAILLFDDPLPSNARVRGKFSVDTGGDDDWIGFVFGYKNASNLHVFDWAKGGQNNVAQMRVRVARSESTLEASSFDLDDTPQMVTIARNLVGWQSFVEYDFDLQVRDDGYSITIRQGTQVLFDQAFFDDTLSGGKFGFYNNSQSDVVYSGFVTEAIPAPTYLYDADALDPDGDSLHFALTTAPDGMLANPQTGEITWAPTVAQIGDHPVTLRVDDGRGGVAEQSYVVTVHGDPANRPPVIVSEPVRTAQLSSAIGPAIPFDLSRSTAVQYIGTPASDGPANWVVQNSDTIRQTRNSDAAILLFDSVDVANSFITGSWRIDTQADDDWVGFVFGYQDRNHFYILDWAQGNENNTPGIRIRVADAAVELTNNDLYGEDNASIRTIATSPVPWQDLTDYEFSLDFHPGVFEISITQGSDIVYSTIVQDDTYAGGKFGFYNGSQGDVLYRGFSAQPTSDSRYRYDVDAIDPDGDPLIFDLVEKPTGMAIDPATGVITWSPAVNQIGGHPVTVRVSDGRGGFDKQSWTIDVQQVGQNRSPRIISSPPTQGNAARIISDGVVGYWTFDGNGADYSGFNRNVEFSAASQFDAGLFGQSFALRGDGAGYATRPGDDDDFDFGQRDFSVQVWVNFNNTSGEQVLIEKFSGASGPGWTLANRDTSWHAFTNSTNQQISSAPQDIPVGVWHQVVLRRAGAVFEIFYNGDSIIRVENGNGILDTVSPLLIGRRNFGDPRVFGVNGRIDETAIWNRALTNEEIDFLYNNGSGRSLLASGYSYDVVAIDPDGDAVNFELAAAPRSMSIDRVSGRIVWNPTTADFGRHAVTVRVSDGRGGEATQTFFVDIIGEPLSEITGTVFHDLNGDGQWQEGRFLVSSFTNAQVQAHNAARFLLEERLVTPGSGGLTGPAGMALGPSGELYVASYLGDAVFRYDGATGKFLSVLDDGGLLQRPVDVAYGPDGLLYVSGELSNNVVRFDVATGEFVDEFITAGRGNLSFARGLEFAPNGDLLVVSAGANSVKRYRLSDGAYLGDFIPAGSGDLNGPFDLVFGPGGNLFVSSYEGGSVLEYDGQTGVFTRAFVPEIDDPIGVEFGPDGSLYVSAAGGVRRYDGETGQFLNVAAAHNLVSGFDLTRPMFVTFVVGTEPVLRNWRLFLDNNRNGARDDGERIAVSDANGRYSFNNLSAGDYVVAEETQNGWLPTTPASGVAEIQLEAGEVVSRVDFGNRDLNAVGINRLTFTSAAPRIATVGVAYVYAPAVYSPTEGGLEFDLATRPDGMVANPSTGRLIWTPSAAQVGANDVTLRVRDGRGGVDLQSFQITVSAANTAPTITSAPSGPAVVGLPWRYQVTAQDAEGDPLVYSLDVAPSGMTIDPAAGLVRWTPAVADLPQQRVEIRVSDGRSATVQFFDLPTVATASNDPPAIRSTPPQTIVLGRQYRYQLSADDPNGDPLSYSVTSGPAGMSVDPATGLVRWTPTASQIGPSQVVLRVEDGRGGVATQTFTVLVVTESTNGAPQITSNPPQGATPGTPYAYDPIAFDPDGDQVLWSLDQAPRGMSIDGATGRIRWMPSVDQLGVATVMLRATDSQGAAATQTYGIAVGSTNRAPLITSIPPTQAVVGQLYVYGVVAADPEGDAVTFLLDAAPAGMTINPTTGQIRWTPTATQLGVQQVTVRAADALGAFVTQSYGIGVNSSAGNGTPLITSAPTGPASVGSLYQYRVTAVDPDGDAVTFSLPTAPAGMTIDPATGLVSWTPSAGQLGSHPIVVAVTDPAGARGSQSFTLPVLAANRNPTITSTPPTAATPGALYRYDVRSSDPDGDGLAIRLAAAPTGMTLDTTTGRIQWTPTAAQLGPAAVAVEVLDGRGGVARQEFVITVAADAAAPTVSLIVTLDPPPVGEPFQVQVIATDNVGVVSRALTVNGVPATLSSQGVATVTATAAGPLVLVATATDGAGNVGTATRTLEVYDSNITGAPEVELTSPAVDPITGAAPTITAPVDVRGTADDPDFAFYKLEIVRADGTVVREIARGATPVVNGLLGRLDPSMLANDSYILRLTAQDTGLNESTIETPISVAGELKLGNFTLSFTDLTVPVSGIPIILGRTYDTLNSDQQDDFGYGWRMEFRDADLRTSVPAPTELERDLGIYNAFYSGARVYVTVPGGKREGFTFQPQPAPGLAGSFLGIWEPKFVPDPGVTSTLSVGNFPLYRIDAGERAGEFVGYTGGGNYNPASSVFGDGLYTLTTKEGIVYTIDGDTGDMERVADSNGNTLTFTDAAIRSSNGPQITFERDARGRITAVVDPSGAKIRYAYDAAGNLASVTDRAGNVTRYEYLSDPAHYLTKVIDPLGREGIRSEYGADGRLRRLLDASGKTIEMAYDTANSLYTTTDQLGNPTTYEYDQRGNVVTQIDAMNQVTRMTYDASNNLLTETDPLGQPTTHTYDSRGNRLTTTDALGRVTRYAYGVNNQVTTIVDPLGNVTTNGYDSVGNLTSITGQASGPTSFAYDPRGNLTALTDGSGTTSFEYDGAGRVTKQTDALGHTTTYAYDANGRQTSETRTLSAPTGVRTLVTRTEYDGEGRVAKTIDAEGGVAVYQYDAAGNRIAVTDARGFTTRFVYNALGQLVETIYPDATPGDADNPRARTEYDAAGRVTAEIDELGRRTEYRYDVLGRRTTTIYPDATPGDLADNPRTRSEYDAAGRVTAEYDELGHATRYEYDAVGQLTITVLADATSEDLSDNPRIVDQYDAAGRRVASIDPLGRVTQFVYDATGRLRETRFADEGKTTSTFDAAGRLTARTDQEGHTTRYEYDGLRRLTAVVDALSKRTEYAYDEAGNLILQRDANGHVTRYEYDGLGRRTATVLPLLQRSTSQYDALGNITSTTDFNGDRVTYEYDPRGRLIAKRYPDLTSVTYAYTPVGQRASVIDARGTTSYQYDARDRLLSRTDPDGKTIAWQYDPAGNRTAVVLDSGTTFYEFDAQNRLAEVTDSSGGVTRYQYDAAGALVRTDLPNGTFELRSYDNVGRLKMLENRGPGGLINRFDYTLDKTGARKSVVETHGAAVRQVDYSYDAVYKLLGETITDSANGNRTIAYDYDPVGNRRSRTDSVEGTTTYTYDDNDRLLAETLAGQITQYQYDANGNTLSKIASATDRAFYDWDYDNRLIAADVTDASGAKRLENRYDADGMRVEQTVDGQSMRYLLDTVQPYAQVVEEYTPGGVILAKFVYGHDLISQDRTGSGGGTSFYHVDGLGSTRALTDPAGAVTDRYLYDAFGRLLSSTGGTANSYLYAGEQRDAGLGLDYLRARYLNPATGRFVSRDSFPGSFRDPLSLHRYLYAASNPANNIDPTGLFTIASVIAVTAISDIRIAFSLAQVRAGVKAICALRDLVPPAITLQNLGLQGIANDVPGADELYQLGRLKFAEAVSQVPKAFAQEYQKLADDLFSVSVTLHITGGSKGFLGAGGLKNVNNAAKILNKVHGWAKFADKWGGRVALLTKCLGFDQAAPILSEVQSIGAELSRRFDEISPFVNISVGPFSLAGAPAKGGLKPSFSQKFNQASFSVPGFIARS